MSKYVVERWDRKGSGSSLFSVKTGGTGDVKTTRNGQMWEACTAIRGHGVCYLDLCCCRGPCLSSWLFCSRGLWQCPCNVDLLGLGSHLRPWCCLNTVLSWSSHHTVAPAVIQVQKRWPCSLLGHCGRAGPSGVGMGELVPPIAGHKTKVSSCCNMAEELGGAGSERRWKIWPHDIV